MSSLIDKEAYQHTFAYYCETRSSPAKCPRRNTAPYVEKELGLIRTQGANRTPVVPGASTYMETIKNTKDVSEESG